MSEKEQIKLLKEFIYNDNVQKQLQEITNSLKTYNIFDIVGMGEQEIKHSNFLGWLFELEIDGHGYIFLEEFLRECISVINEDNNLKNYIYLKQKNNIKIYREYQNIDLIIEDKNNKILIIIENKINAGEDRGDENREGQLEKYKKIVDNHFEWKDWQEENKFFYLLSPDGVLASGTNSNTWKSIDYGVIAKPLEKILKNINNGKISLNPDFTLLIEHYLDLLYRKGIVMNEEVKRLCYEIWKNNKEALNILFQNKPGLIDIMEDIKKYINEKLNMKDEIHWISSQKNANTDYYLYLPKWLEFFNINEKINTEDIKTKYIGLGIYFTKTYIQIWILPLNENVDDNTKKIYEKIKTSVNKGLKINTKNTTALKNFNYQEFLYKNDDEKFDEINIEQLKEEIVKTLETINNCFANEN